MKLYSVNVQYQKKSYSLHKTFGLLLEKNKCGICVDPADPKAIAKAITYLKTHPEEAKAMGENGKRLVQETYNWKAEEKKLFEFYQALMS